MADKGGWVMLAYRMPREPSTPRIAVWRRLRRLGVAQPVDGLVLLPDEPRTREGLEWVAERVVAADGQATLWTAAYLSGDEEDTMVQSMNSAIAAEYAAVSREARAVAAEGGQAWLAATRNGPNNEDSSGDRGELRRRAAQLARTLSQVQSRDYFGADGRVEAEQAILALT
ncbi:hypothetical protein SAMN05661080_03942, partial [Modestobacter sp. DSM 44400]